MAKFTQVAEVEVPNDGNVVDHPAVAERNVAADALMLALGALSKRALTALASLFTLTTVVSVWWLWMSMLNPSVTQLISLGMYALFVLAINVVVLRRK